MTNKEEFRKKWAKVVAKAWMDGKFKAQLIAHPHQVLKEFGIHASANTTYKILEETEKMHFLVIPQKPEGMLSEAELMKIAAASDCYSTQ